MKTTFDFKRNGIYFVWNDCGTIRLKGLDITKKQFVQKLYCLLITMIRTMRKLRKLPITYQTDKMVIGDTESWITGIHFKWKGKDK